MMSVRRSYRWFSTIIQSYDKNIEAADAHSKQQTAHGAYTYATQ